MDSLLLKEVYTDQFYKEKLEYIMYVHDSLSLKYYCYDNYHFISKCFLFNRIDVVDFIYSNRVIKKELFLHCVKHFNKNYKPVEAFVENVVLLDECKNNKSVSKTKKL